MRALIVLTALGMLAAACGTGSTDQSIPPPDVTTVPTTVPVATTVPPMAPASSAPDEPAQARIVEAAVVDLADRLGVEAEEIVLVSFEWLTWNDGSIGCPEPGVVYTQALVEGSRIILGHDGLEYDYHAGATNQPFLCESTRSGPGPGTPSTTPES